MSRLEHNSPRWSRTHYCGRVHVVIMGCGRVGSTLARSLEDRNHTVSIIDSNPDAFRRLGPSFNGTLAVGVVPYSADVRLAPEAAMIALLYEQRFGASPRSGLSLSHFAGAALCYDVLRRAGSADKDKTLAVARSMRLDRGDLANGWGALFGAGGQNLRAFSALSQWQNGEAVTLLPAEGAAGRYRRL